MNSKQLEYILKVKEEQSFTKAAEKLGISQPYLSQFISNVEKNIGMYLFDRMVTPVKLTQAGEVFCARANEILKLHNDMILELNDLKGFRSGKVVIGVSQLGASFIPKVVPTFLKKFPDIEILVKECDSARSLESWILNGEVDIGALPLMTPLENLDYEIIQEKRMVLALPAKHPLSKEIKKNYKDKYPLISLALLKEEKFILPEKPQQTYLLLDKPFIEAGFTPRILCTTRTMDVANAIVASGIGACFTLPEMVRDEYRDKISLFRIDNVHMQRKMVLAYKKGKYLPRVAKEFIAVAKRKLAMYNTL